MPYIGIPERPNNSEFLERRPKYFVFPWGESFAHIPPNNIHYIYPAGYEMNASEERIRESFVREAIAKRRTQFGTFLRHEFPRPFDMNFFIDGLANHGPFALHMLYGEMELRSRLAIQTASIELREEFSEVTGGPDPIRYDDPIEQARAALSLLLFTWDDFLLEGMSSEAANSALAGWYESIGGLRPCELCGKVFDRVWLIDGWYRGTRGHHVCLSCPLREYPTGALLDSRLREFVDLLGYIPDSSSFQIQMLAALQFPNSHQYSEICIAWMKMGGIDYIKEQYGSWFHGLARSGVLPDGVQVTTRGVKCLADDGHMCRSLSELRIDNWLYHYGIEHECEPRYPYHKTLNPEGNVNKGGLRADWRVGDTYIEYFGLAGDPTYDEKIVRKRAIAETFDMKLIALMPVNLARLDEALGHLVPHQAT